MENLEGRIKISERDITSYSTACLRALEVIDHEDPKRMICLLRGGYPPSRVLYALSGEYLGKSLDSFPIPTSDFLKNKKSLVYSLTDNSINFAKNSQNHGKIFSVDTAISGSSSRQFMNEFTNNFQNLASCKRDVSEDVVIDYTLVRFWHDSEDRYSRTKRKPSLSEHRQRSDSGSGKEFVLKFHVYDFGVRNLISEDKPVLLGMDYPIEFKKEDNGGIHGKKSEYIEKVLKTDPITMVQDGGEITYQPHGEQTTADLFVDLIVQRSREQVSFFRELFSSKPSRDREGNINMDPNNPYRVNLKVLQHPPYLVDFCGQLVRKTIPRCK